MNALILAAGFGTRLLPLTKTTPKALLPIDGKPMLQIAIENLVNQGFSQIVVNVHHLASQIIDFVRTHRFEARVLISDERARLMDTGGAIVHARKLLDNGEPFLVHNVDIISNINLGALFRAHLQSNALATLAVSPRQSNRAFLFDGQMLLCGWENRDSQQQIVERPATSPLQRFAFAGIHVIGPQFFTLEHPAGAFPIVPEYLRLCRSQPIVGVNFAGCQVRDMGKFSNFSQHQQ